MSAYCFAVTTIGVPGDISGSKWDNNFNLRNVGLRDTKIASFCQATWSPTLGAHVSIGSKDAFYIDPLFLPKGVYVLHIDSSQKTHFVFMKTKAGEQELDYVAGSHPSRGEITLIKGSTLDQKPIDTFYAHIERLETLKSYREGYQTNALQM
jgi:hypothetical protein